MKRVNLTIRIAATVMLLWVSNTFASNPDKEQINHTGIRKAIEKQIPFPAFARENKGEQKVSVSFQIEENGKITVISTTGSDTRLNNYVEQKLNAMQIETGYELKGKVVNIDIKFQIL